MTRIKFVKSTKSEFLKLLGVKSGVLVAIKDGEEGGESPLIVDLERQMKMLRDNEKKGILTNDEVNMLEKAMRDAGIESLAAMFEKVRNFPIPDDYSSSHNFQICSMPNCKQPLVHGYIYDRYDTLLLQIDTISTLTNGFSVCENLVRNNQNNKLDAVIVFRQMLEANLALDNDELETRYNALPEETRLEFENDEEKKRSKLITPPN